MSQLELDPQFTQGLRLLHSTNKDSAEQLRVLLDEAIKLKYGPSKMLSNVLHKKVIPNFFIATLLYFAPCESRKFSSELKSIKIKLNLISFSFISISI